MSADTPQFEGITPYLHYDDVAAMVDWLIRVFGFIERGRWLDTEGTLRNAELYAGTTEVWLDGEAGYWSQKGRRPEEWIGVWVDDVDAMFERVKAAGVETDPPENKFYGIRVFDVADPEGYTWGFMERCAYVARFEG
ncbi:MAG: VOC family protein [Acidobacteriia bacterium]|nr:VOC family protein [Terriglobia bacterium]